MCRSLRRPLSPLNRLPAVLGAIRTCLGALCPSKVLFGWEALENRHGLCRVSTDNCMRILQVSMADKAGGAEAVAWQLFQSYRRRGHGSWLAVSLKQSDDVDVLAIRNDSYRSSWARACIAGGDLLAHYVSKVRGADLLCRLFRNGIGQPRRSLDIWQGKEDFHYPATWRLLDILPNRPDILHCQNMHVGYFDLRALPWLSHQVPVVLTLHDAWLLSGHCAHSFDCERWRIGCGQCPDLTIYPPIKRDATAFNWKRKREIYSKSRLYVATPSRWLMNKVRESMLATAAVETRVIPNGVDLTVFRADDKKSAKRMLGIAPDTKVLLFTANGIKRSMWRDFETMRSAVAQVARRLCGQRVLFIALGEDAPVEWIGGAEIRFVPYQSAPEAVARYYQAADVYVHAAKADTFPNTIIEALACGTPVVATAVGGIPEQVKGADIANETLCISSFNRCAPQEATGFLLPPGDEESIVGAIERLLTDESLRCRLGQNAASDAQKRFDLERQVDKYLNWYEEIRTQFNAKRSFM